MKALSLLALIGNAQRLNALIGREHRYAEFSLNEKAVRIGHLIRAVYDRFRLKDTDISLPRPAK